MRGVDKPLPGQAQGHPLKSVYVWIIIAVPLSSVIMGAVLLWLSISSFDGMVADDYYRQGLQINQDLSRDRAARGAGLRGRLATGPANTRLNLQAAAPAFQPPASISLSFSHATRGGLDQILELPAQGNGRYQGPGVTLAPGRWYLQAFAGSWRIAGTLVVKAPGGNLETVLTASGPDM